MFRTTRSRAVLAAAVCSAALVTASCSSSSTASGESSSSEAAAPSSAAASVAATESAAPSAAASGESKGTLGLQVPVANEFTQCLATGFIKAAQAAGYDYTIGEAGFQDNDVLADFDRMIAENVKGIVVLPTSDQSSSQGTLAAEAAGIPVVSAGWFSKTEADDAYEGRLKVDVDSGAKMVAEWIGANTEPGEVVFVSGAPGVPTSDAFEKTLGTAIDALDGDWKLVGTEPGNYSRSDAITAIENLTTAHPDAKIIVSLSADMGDGVATFLASHDMTGYTHISGDSDLVLVKNMLDGGINAVLYWGAAEQGELATNLLINAIDSGSGSSDITPIPISIETPDTIEATVAKRPLCYEDLLTSAENMS